MNVRVTIVDYGIGNLWSVRSALRYLGHDSVVSTTPSEVAQADTLILPGVGSFRKAMLALRSSQLDEAILEAVTGKRRKILGICLGMQLLAMRGTEDGETAGLGLISTDVERFDSEAMGRLKVPHIGFNQVRSGDQSVLFEVLHHLPISILCILIVYLQMASKGTTEFVTTAKIFWRPMSMKIFLPHSFILKKAKQTD
jgi:glutamine amidotransferase